MNRTIVTFALSQKEIEILLKLMTLASDAIKEDRDNPEESLSQYSYYFLSSAKESINGLEKKITGAVKEATDIQSNKRKMIKKLRKK